MFKFVAVSLLAVSLAACSSKEEDVAVDAVTETVPAEGVTATAGDNTLSETPAATVAASEPVVATDSVPAEGITATVKPE